MLKGTSACLEMVSFHTMGESVPWQSSIAAEAEPKDGAKMPLSKGTSRIERRITALRCNIRSPLNPRLTTRFLRHSSTLDVAKVGCNHFRRFYALAWRESSERVEGSGGPYQAIRHHQRARRRRSQHSVWPPLQFHSVDA